MQRLNYSIGEASERCGVKVATIRYYEQIGLLGATPRTGSNRRVYEGADVQRLAFIRHARQLGFEINAIRELIALQENPSQSCVKADEIARLRLEEVSSQIRALTSLKVELERMVQGLAHGKISDCRVIEILADHRHCLDEH